MSKKGDCKIYIVTLTLEDVFIQIVVREGGKTNSLTKKALKILFIVTIIEILYLQLIHYDRFENMYINAIILHSMLNR